MPVLLRSLSPFSDSSRKGVDSDTVRQMYRLTTIPLFFTLERSLCKQVLSSLSLQANGIIFTTEAYLKSALWVVYNKNSLNCILSMNGNKLVDCVFGGSIKLLYRTCQALGSFLVFVSLGLLQQQLEKSKKPYTIDVTEAGSSTFFNIIIN